VQGAGGAVGMCAVQLARHAGSARYRYGAIVRRRARSERGGRSRGGSE
jgi:NADPH:quinone reductase-like Zn-dependent oxidoreductase